MDEKTYAVASASCCRLCLLDDGIKLPIFEGEGVQRQVAHKIQACFPILIYVGDPLPKMICHKCLFKLDSAYDFRLMCLDTNSILKKKLLTMTHVAEVKEYLNNLEPSCLSKGVEHTTVEVELRLPAGRQVNTSVPVVPDDKAPVTEHNMEPVQIDSTTENVFQEVFLEDCSTDVFFPEQCPDDTTQANGNNLDESSSREQTVSTASASSVDSAISGCAITIKQEPQDETTKDDDPHEYGKSKGLETPQPPTPRNDTEHHADVESVPIVPEKVKQEKVDTTDLECSKCKVRFQDNGELQKHVCTVLSQWRCQDCNKYFKSKPNLRKHKKYACHKKRSFVCRKCGKIFNSVVEMAQHQKVHLRICVFLQEDSLYTCTVCRKKFAARSMLEMHKKSHSIDTLYMNQNAAILVQPSISTGKVLPKRFKCHYCPSSYTTRSKLKLHIKTHFAGKINIRMPERSVETRQSNKSDTAGDAMPECSKKFTCKYCQHAFANSAALWNHMLQQHITDQAYRCDTCGRSFSHLHAFTNHKKTHDVTMNCRVCGKRYTSEKSLREHEYNKHGIQKATHRCRLCTESFMTRSELLIHGRTHHKKGKVSAPVLEESEVKTGSFPCSLCSEHFPTPVALVAHMQMHIGMDMGNRNMGSSNISNLNQGPKPQSSSWEEAERSLSLTCKICFRLFNSMACLQRHIKMHATGKHTFYPCKICGKKFVSESTYKNHMATHVSASFNCDSCNKLFLNEESFKCHICENTEKQACLKCGTLLTEEQRLNHDCDDNISKSSNLPGRCSICLAIFSSVNALNSHMRIHGNQMNLAASKKIVKMSNGMYKCTFCGKLSETQQGAAAHSRCHVFAQPVKAYGCPFCKRKYSAESALYTHITVEHPEMPSKFQ